MIGHIAVPLLEQRMLIAVLCIALGGVMGQLALRVKWIWKFMGEKNHPLVARPVTPATDTKAIAQLNQEAKIQQKEILDLRGQLKTQGEFFMRELTKMQNRLLVLERENMGAIMENDEERFDDFPRGSDAFGGEGSNYWNQRDRE